MINVIKGPEPGFEPGTKDPQSHMLPDYTTQAIKFFKVGLIVKDYLKLYVFFL